jgi:DNA-binding MarR family transcriptional regulator
VTKRHSGHLVQDFLGSAQIFTSAINDLLEGQLRAVSEEPLTFSQLKLLKMVSLTEGYTVSDVANFLGVSNAAASRAVDRLVRRGLVDRTESEADRRAVRISQTNEGRDLVARYDSAANQVLAQLFGEFSSEELNVAAGLLDHLSVSIVDQDAQREAVCFRCGIHFRERCLLRQVAQRNCHFHVRPADNGGAQPTTRQGR